MNNLKFRYILSIIIDYAIYIGLVACLTKSEMFWNKAVYVIFINAFLILFWLEEMPFKGYSVGKFIVRIKVISKKNNSNLFIKQLIVRRILEILHVYKVIFWRLEINIDKISESKIVKYNTLKRSDMQNKENSKDDGKSVDTLLRSLRVKAFFIDLFIIIWIPLIISIIRIPLLRSHINTWYEFLVDIIDGSLTILFVLYWILKDIKYTNGSYGKKRVGICIKSDDGFFSTKTQRVVKNILAFGFFPVEIIMFIMGKKTLSESVSFTHIESV